MNNSIARAISRAEVELAGAGIMVAESHAAIAIAQALLEEALGLNACVDDIHKATMLAAKAIEITGVKDFSLWFT